MVRSGGAPMFEVAVMVASGGVLALAVWVLVRRRSLRWTGRIPDVPDAEPTSAAIEAPGLTLPYSSVDWTAPPKLLEKRTGTDDTSESESEP